MIIKIIRIPVFFLITIVFFSLFINGFFSSGDNTFPYAKAVTYVGNCGENAKWTLNLKKGSLTISGSGAINSFDEKETPWFKYRDEIKRIIISDSITSIGDNVFSFLDKTEKVSVPGSLKTIGYKAFYGCADLKEIKGSFSSLTEIGESAFAYCRKLKVLPDFPSLETVGENSFYYCYSLPAVTLGYSVTSIKKCAFAYCEGLENIKIVNYKCEIADDENTFYKNTNIEGFSKSTAYDYSKRYNKSFSKIKDINYLNDLKIKLQYSETVYDGAKKKPNVLIKGLKQGQDYTVRYSDNINPGLAKVTVYAAGDTLGKKTKTFRILPAEVENVRLKSRTSDSISVKWDKTVGADKYEIYQLVNGKWIKSGETERTSYKVSGLKGASEYSLRVRAITVLKNNRFEGKFSKTFSDFTSPESPAIEKISLVRGGGKLRVTIKKINGVSGYELYMSTDENGDYKKVSNLTSSSKLTVTIDNLSNSNTYYFKVRTFMKNGDNKVFSGYSEVMSSNVL